MTNTSYSEDLERPRTAPTGAVLAEIGSLSMEFTRLAQITKEPKYYDAIARITNEFDVWQNSTRLPGLWPVMLDSSGGCDVSTMQRSHSESKAPSPPPAHDGGVAMPPKGPSRPVADGALSPEQAKEALRLKNEAATAAKEVEKEEAEQAAKDLKQKDSSTFADDSKDNEKGYSLRKRSPSTAQTTLDKCVNQGLSTRFAIDKFTLGGQADSVYEYLPKVKFYLSGVQKLRVTNQKLGVSSTWRHC